MPNYTTDKSIDIDELIRQSKANTPSNQKVNTQDYCAGY